MVIDILNILRLFIAIINLGLNIKRLDSQDKKSDHQPSDTQKWDINDDSHLDDRP